MLRSSAPGDFTAVEATSDRIYAESRRVCFEGSQPVLCGWYLVAHQVSGAGARVEATWEGFLRRAPMAGLDHRGADLIVAQDDIFAKAAADGEPTLILDSDDMVAADPRAASPRT